MIDWAFIRALLEVVVSFVVFFVLKRLFAIETTLKLILVELRAIGSRGERAL